LNKTGATVKVHDPMYSEQELRDLGFITYHYGEPLDAAIFQADHAEYASLTPSMLGNARTLLNGRNINFARDFPNSVSIGSGTIQPFF
jgi:UDP-N-acetyl-D-mannosaminuronate dehydrogenase